ncbi:MAG: DUF1592 domain-containing protein, partial [Lentisphaeraceae bacterium]|nr:DUF1592 domain-containing protein [Lentisphaeraceae bacterium]
MKQLNKLITIMPCLFLSFVITAQTKPAATQLPTLSKAREIGRSKSNLLNTKNLKNSSSQLAPKANLSDFNKVISPLFKNKCLACHGPKKVKGKFRIDKLDPNLLKGADINKWLEVYEVLSNSEMPPDDEPDYHLADADRSKIVDWLGAEVRKASQVRRTEKGHSSFRRMARYEYNNALQDLLGLPYDFVERLVTETISEDGFKNSSEHLNMTAMQFQIYREIGLQALKKSTVSGEQPQPVTYSISMQEEMEKGIKKLLKKRAKDQRKAAQKKGKQKKAGKKKGKTKIYIYNKKDENYKNILRKLRLVNRQSGDVILSTLTYFAEPNSASAAVNNPPPSPVTLVLNQNKEIVLNLGNHLPDEGTMRISIRVSRTTMKENDYASLRLLFGAHTSNNANFMEIVSKADMPVTATPDKPQIIHFDIPLSEIRRNPFRKNKTVFPRRDELLTIKNISNVGKARKGQESLEVLIHHIEISGPYYEQWPPKTHSDIFIKSQNKSDENKYCRQILKRFMQRSWRRPVTSAEVERYAALFSKFRPQLANFEDTMLEVLAAVLASPEFLYLTQTKQAKVSKSGGNISDFELANRLSFFLWSRLPDLTLLKLAHQQKLNDPKVLLAQVKRLLADKRGQRFSQSFVPQWLGLDGIHSVSIDKKLHTSFNPDLQESMLKEPLAFFSEVLKNNSSIMDFIHSDYAVINQSLAR